MSATTCLPECLETRRLTLRRWQREDSAAIIAIWSSPAVLRALQTTDFASRFEHHLHHWEEHGFGLYVLERRDEPGVIGWVGPTHPDFIPELADAIELGWTLDPAHWGNGFASEAASAVLVACFSHLDVDELISLIHPDNAPSRRVAERLGMRPGRRALHPQLGIELDVWALKRVATPG